MNSKSYFCSSLRTIMNSEAQLWDGEKRKGKREKGRKRKKEKKMGTN